MKQLFSQWGLNGTEKSGYLLLGFYQYAKRANFEVHTIIKEKVSGMKNQKAQRQKVMALAQAREIAAILVTELTRERSTIDLIQTINELQAWNVSLIAQAGFQFDVSTA